MKTGYNALYKEITGKELQTEEKREKKEGRKRANLKKKNTMAVSNLRSDLLFWTEYYKKTTTSCGRR